MFGLAHSKNEEYTLYLACAWARILEERTIYVTITLFTNGLPHDYYFSICSLQMEYRSAASFSNGANRKASLTNGDFLPMAPLVRVS